MLTPDFKIMEIASAAPVVAGFMAVLEERVLSKAARFDSDGCGMAEWAERAIPRRQSTEFYAGFAAASNLIAGAAGVVGAREMSHLSAHLVEMAAKEWRRLQ